MEVVLVELEEIGDSGEDYAKELEALNLVIKTLKGLPQKSRERLLQTIITFFGTDSYVVQSGTTVSTPVLGGSESTSSFSEDRSMTPKEFLLEKQPQTDIERVACLAYYLTHYLSEPHFKTLDISKLNTEAAQRKFTNAAKAVNNATTKTLLVPATKGNKQLSAHGELFVQALPDREAAKAVLSLTKPRRKNKSSTKRKSGNGY